MLSSLSSLPISLLLLTTATALDLDCSLIRVDKKSFDLSKLGGQRSIWVQDTLKSPSISNTTWTLDICQNLKKPKSSEGVPKEDQCPNYTRVCGVTRTYNPFDDPDGKSSVVTDVIPVAGNYHLSGKGGYLEPKFTRLKSQDSDREGVVVEVGGGRYEDLRQKAVIEFVCDKEVSGLERRTRVEAEDDDGEGEGERWKQDPDNALQFVSYGPVEAKEGLVDVLRLEWRTRYACESSDAGDDEDEDKEKKSSGGWGFFTWFILM